MNQLSLPPFVLTLLNRLEAAGFPTYAVGGCVRDMLLGIVPHDYDLCTAALPEQTAAVFSDCRLVLAGMKHGTVGVLTDSGVVEITTFRREGTYRDNRHPDWVRFVPNIEDDLARRDFTVNAMAWSPLRGFADPFGGQADLNNRILRAVGDPATRYREDSLRILRGVRFAVRFRLTPEENTLSAMFTLAAWMDNLARERVFDELCKLLPLISAAQLCLYAPILTAVIPELAPMVGFDQHSPHHLYDVFTHTAYVTEAVPPELPLRWAALLHDVGKVPTFTRDETGRGHFYGHAQVGADLADTVLSRLKAPTGLREQVTWLIRHHMTPFQPDRKLLRRWISRWGLTKTRQLLALQQADFCSKGVRETQDSVFPAVAALLDQMEQEQSCLTLKDLAVTGRDLIALGFPPGPRMGACLNHLLNLVVDEAIPNRYDALAQAAGEFQNQTIHAKEDSP